VDAWLASLAPSPAPLLVDLGGEILELLDGARRGDACALDGRHPGPERSLGGRPRQFTHRSEQLAAYSCGPDAKRDTDKKPSAVVVRQCHDASSEPGAIAQVSV
jgi:hypothetical protein